MNLQNYISIKYSVLNITYCKEVWVHMLCFWNKWWFISTDRVTDKIRQNYIYIYIYILRKMIFRFESDTKISYLCLEKIWNSVSSSHPQQPWKISKKASPFLQLSNPFLLSIYARWVDFDCDIYSYFKSNSATLFTSQSASIIEIHYIYIKKINLANNERYYSRGRIISKKVHRFLSSQWHYCLCFSTYKLIARCLLHTQIMFTSLFAYKINLIHASSDIRN